VTEPVASLQNIGKRYVKYDDVPTLLTGMRRMFKRGKRGILWAVRNFNLDIHRGDAVGIIGRNGSGKSTTLSMLAGVTAPTEGIVRVQGRLAPLLKLGVGFQNELTGRENVYINSVILGMTTAEVERRFDDIVAFAEMEKFIDTPVKFYSSGMMVRLGFASALAADPDLLIIDEVLSVGDVAFQMRCFDRMSELRERGTTLVVVSHNLGAIRRLAEKVVVLHDGEERFVGGTNDGIGVYHDLLRMSLLEHEHEAGASGGPVSVLSFDLFAEDGAPTSNVRTGEVGEFRMRVKFNQNVQEAAFGVAIVTEAGQFVYAENSAKGGTRDFNDGEIVTLCMRAPVALTTGTYSATAGIVWGKGRRENMRSPTKAFYVSGRPLVRGVADLNVIFEVDESGAERVQVASDGSSPTAHGGPEGSDEISEIAEETHPLL
jgi:ABC-type polysaccharide/polyol phosphate transport system ATPase subunit